MGELLDVLNHDQLRVVHMSTLGAIGRGLARRYAMTLDADAPSRGLNAVALGNAHRGYMMKRPWRTDTQDQQMELIQGSGLGFIQEFHEYIQTIKIAIIALDTAKVIPGMTIQLGLIPRTGFGGLMPLATFKLGDMEFAISSLEAQASVGLEFSN